MVSWKILTPIAVLLLTVKVCYSQSVIEELDIQEQENSLLPNMSSEKVEKISPSRKIYLITNGNQSFQKGDFISLIYKGTLFARALVAKDINGLSGIKLLRIHSPPTASSIRPGYPIQVIRGDDSLFLRGLKRGSDGSELVIQNEEDLFNKTAIWEGENEDLDQKSQNLIKQDNIVSIWYGQIEGTNLQGESTRYSHFLGSWGYQVGSNIWAEATYGQNVIKDFPEIGFDTRIQNFNIKFKYTIATPAYSYVQPYIGYQLLYTESPGAGKQNPAKPVSPEQLELERQRLKQIEKNTPIFGFGVLKRLVPGWFVKLELGSDIIGGGLALEF